jgi:hypothetical protein
MNTPSSEGLAHAVQVLQQQFENLQISQSNIAPTPPPRIAKVNNPDPYYGDRSKLQIFISQLALKFSANSHEFPSDQVKLSYAGSYLRGDAFAWFAPQVKETGEVDYATYAEFVKGLRDAFGDPDEVATAEREIQELRQGTGTCSTYYAQFTRIMSKLDWNDATKIYMFRRGLREELKDLLVGKDHSQEFVVFVKQCITLDNEWQARQQEKKARRPPHHP